MEGNYKVVRGVDGWYCKVDMVFVKVVDEGEG